MIMETVRATQLIEETDKEKAMASDNDFGRKALMLSTAFVIKVRKLLIVRGKIYGI